MVILFGSLAGVGAVLLLVGLLTGFDLDLPGGDSGILSLPAIGAFCAGSGIAGLVLVNTGSAMPALWAGLAGVVAWLPVAVVGRALRRTEDGLSGVEKHEFVGTIVEVVHPVRGSEEGLGDVVVRGEQMRKRLIGVGDETLVAGSKAVVVDIADNGSLVVDAAPEWID